MSMHARVNEILGHPADARLLNINLDDFGMLHAINAGILEALEHGLARSTTIMVPCPWAIHGFMMLKERPYLHFGVHLTAISERKNYRWGPVSPRSSVPSLIDEEGYFYPEDRMQEFLSKADLSELETEFRAQIDTVLAEGLTPTHLDSIAMSTHGGTTSLL